MKWHHIFLFYVDPQNTPFNKVDFLLYKRTVVRNVSGGRKSSLPTGVDWTISRPWM